MILNSKETSLGSESESDGRISTSTVTEEDTNKTSNGP